jgi:hypothetical protein
VSRAAQRPLNKRSRFLAVTIGVTEGANSGSREPFQAPLGFEEFLLGDFVVDDGAAEHMRVGVVSDLAAETTKKSELILHEEETAFTPKFPKVDLEALREVNREPANPGVRHCRDGGQQVRNLPRAARLVAERFTDPLRAFPHHQPAEQVVQRDRSRIKKGLADEEGAGQS